MTGVKTIFNSRQSNTFKPPDIEIREYSTKAQALINMSIALAEELTSEIIIEGSKYTVYINIFIETGQFTNHAASLLSSIANLSDNFSIREIKNNPPYFAKIFVTHNELL